ncbi:MAG: signal peptidase I [Methanomicrobiales archaeon]|nr:signal peptidase I [Methanomicrobiales archaeon]
MSEREKERTDPITRFRESKNPIVSLVRDLLWVIGVVGGIALCLFLISGTWPAMVTIESESMIPHMNVGDLVFVVEKDRFGTLVTREEGSNSGYEKFGDYGDVIVYRPNGRADLHPIIHRAMEWLDVGEVEEMYPGLNMHEGYLTKGDNNRAPDQGSYFRGIGVIEPVKGEWIVGKAFFAIPLLGYPALYLPYFALLVVFLLLIHELISRRRSESSPEDEKGRDKRRGRGR